MAVEGVEHCPHHSPTGFPIHQSRAHHEPLCAFVDHDNLGDRNRSRAEQGKVDGCNTDGRRLLKSLSQGLDRGFGDQAVPGGMSSCPRHLADQGVSLPSECDRNPGAVAIGLFGDVDDDWSVALGKVGIGKLDDRDHSAIDGKTEHRLSEALDVPDDLLGRFVDSSQNMNFGYHAALADNPGCFDSRKPAHLLFEVMKVHGRSVAAALGGDLSPKVLRYDLVARRSICLVGPHLSP